MCTNQNARHPERHPKGWPKDLNRSPLKRQPPATNFRCREFCLLAEHRSRITNHASRSSAKRSSPHPAHLRQPAPPAPAEETAAPLSTHPSQPYSSESHKTSPTSATHTSASRTSSRTRRAPSTFRNGNNTRCHGAPTTRQRRPPKRLLTTAPASPRTRPRSNPSAALNLQSTVGRRASSYRKSVPVPEKNR
jgi:hypothetical protein